MAFFLSLLFFSADAQRLFEGKIDVRPGRGVDRKDAIIYLPANYSKDIKNTRWSSLHMASANRAMI
jgi:hypothetical protein